MIKFKSLVKITDSDNLIAEKLSEGLDMSLLTSKVMSIRGISDIENAKDFLNPNIEDLLDPFLLKDMNVAVDRVIKAIHRKENIWIYGDYDVDGVTSTSILILFLKTLCDNVEFYIPDRLSEGYGLNIEAIDHIKSMGGQLIISVDCGIKSFDVAEYCSSIGIDLIITDHHTCDQELPKAIAVINPNRLDSEYTFNKLAGVGVAFKLIQAISLRLNQKIDYGNILPIVTLGTVADIVSLTGENRIIVKNGLSMIKHTDNLGIKALLKVTGLVNREITSGHIGYVIGPRINATGRIGMAKYAVQLLITNDYNEADQLAKMLEEENVKRQVIEAEILKEAEDIINREIDLANTKVLVLASENWHSGVIGIVSSRITEKYHRPSILISIIGDEGRGSARSISSFDLYESLNKCKDFFVKFGGHRQAAGLTIKKDNIEKFRIKINEIADKVLDDIDLVPQVRVDAEIDVGEVIFEIANELKSLEPFGIDNPSPVFLLRNVSISSIRQIGKEGKHLKLSVTNGRQFIDCLGFNFGDYYHDMKIGHKIDLVVSIDINEYLGKLSVQLLIKDIIMSLENRITQSSDYLDSLLSVLNVNNYSDEAEIDKTVLKTLDSNIRTSYVLDTIKENDNILIIINNVFNLVELLDTMKYEGRDFIRRIGINYNMPLSHRPCDIVINPFLNNLNIYKYEKVILYDMCFTKSNLIDIIKNFKQSILQILLVKSDFHSNNSLIKDIVPQIDDIRLIYKTFVSRREEYLRIVIDKYLKSLSNISENHIKRFKFLVIITILKDARLVDYTFKDDYLIVKMMNIPNNKIDITSVPIYEKLDQVSTEIMNLKNTLIF